MNKHKYIILKFSIFGSILLATSWVQAAESTVVQKDNSAYNALLDQAPKITPNQNDVATKNAMNDAIHMMDGVNQRKKQKTVQDFAKQYSEEAAKTHNDALSVAAGITTVVQSDDFQSMQKNWRKKLGDEMGVQQWMEPDDQKKEDVKAKLPYSERPVMFISTSVPLPTLRQYAKDLSKVGGVMIMRGAIGSMKYMRPTFQFIMKVIKRDPNCHKKRCAAYDIPVLIDPLMFRAYHISRVPAFTVHGKTNLANYCKGLAGLHPSKYLILGDKSVGYMLSRLSDLSGDPKYVNLAKKAGFRVD